MKKSVAVVACLLAVGLILGSTPAFALTAQQEAKLLPSEGDDGDLCGFAVALDADTALVSAHADDVHAQSSGSAYVFVLSGDVWMEQAKLVPDDGAYNAGFGLGLALDGDTALFGAPGDDDNGYNSGSAYVYTRTGNVWTQEAKLLPDDGATMDTFSYEAVALEGATAVVGCKGDDDNGPNSGSVYVFERTGGAWVQQTKLLPDDGQSAQGFGRSVALDVDTIVIGASGDSDNGESSGSAYVYTRTAGVWTQQAKLLADDGAEWDVFGSSVALDGDTAVIGAFADSDYGLESGSAYVFTRANGVWTQQAKLLPDDGAAEDRFGSSVALDGDVALIGAYQDGPQSGSAYLFTRVGGAWMQQAKVLSDDGGQNDLFARSVALDGDVAVIGSDRDDDNGPEAGAAYVFRLVAYCGDGGLDPGEECDDGNNYDGDGCAADCTMEQDVPTTSSTGVLLLALAVGGSAAYFMRRPTTS